MLKVAFKNIWARKFRLVTTGFAILLGVAFMSGGLVLTDTIAKSFDELFTDLAAGTSAVVRSSDKIDAGFGGGPGARPRIDDDVLAEVRKVPGVAKAEGDTTGLAQIIGKQGEVVGPDGGAPNLGVVWTDDANSGQAFRLVEGRAPRTDDEVVIDRASAKDGAISINDVITVLTKSGPTRAHVVGISAYRDQDSPGGASVVGFTLPAAQRLLGEVGKFDTISVDAVGGISEEQIRDRIDAALPAQFEVITGDQLANENKDSVAQFVGIFRTILSVFALITLFVGSFIIYNTFSILAAQRTREMALLRAIGASRRQLLGSMLAEASVVGAVASGIGLFVGFGVAVALKAFFNAIGFDLPATGIVIQPRTVVLSIILGMVVTIIAALAPARRASRVPPIAAMRDVALGSVGSSRARMVLGGLITIVGVLLVFGGLTGGGIVLVGLGAALTFLGVAALGPLFAGPIVGMLGGPVVRTKGTVGRLARDNAIRNPKRTSRTAAALLIGVALVSFITIFAASAKASFHKIYDDQFTGDFVVHAGGGFGGAGFSPALAESLKHDRALGTVASLRAAPAEFNGNGEFLSAVDADAGQMFDLAVQQGSLDDLDAGALAVHVDKAAKEGWKIGTTVPVRFPGTAEIPLTVKVIYGQDTIAGSHFVGLPVFDKYVADNLDVNIFVDAANGVSEDDARAAIERHLADYPSAKVQSRDEFIKQSASAIDSVLNVVYVFLALSVIIAMFGIANTLALSVVERTRELGLLRAVGMTRRQLRSTIRWEAVLIALFGTIGGLVVGTFFGWSAVRALKDDGFELFRVPAVRMLMIAALAAAFGVLAAWFPARRAAKLDVLKAIATE